VPKLIPAILFFLIPYGSFAQKFFYTQYRANDGLTAYQVRVVAQDTLGFLWVGTDAGLLRFNGKYFTDYRRNLDSEYIKDLLLTRNGSLLLANDTGVYTIDYQVDTANIEKLIPAGLQTTDTTLLYPNRLFEDSRGRLWVSQPNGTVAAWEAGVLKFYPFGKDHATGYSDSRFSFAEGPAGTLWVAAPTGQCYRFDEEGERFERIRIAGSWNRIHELKTTGDTLWIVGSGLGQARIAPSGKLTRLRYYHTGGRELTAINIDPQSGDLFLGTVASGVFRAEFPGWGIAIQELFGSNDPHRVESLPFQSINDLFRDSDGNLWLSSLQGLGLLQSRFFESVFGLANNNTFYIHPAGDNRILLSFGDVYEIQPEGGDYFGQLLAGLDESFIIAIAAAGAQTWLSTTDGILLRFDNRSMIRRTDLSERGSGIFFMQHDRRGNLWLCQAPDETPIVGVAKLDPAGKLKEYGREQGLDNRILVVRESERGRLYAAGIGPESYLYRYQPEADAFINLSLPLPFAYSQGFEVHDLAIDAQGIVWLGTTDGLLRYDLERIQRVDLGQLTNTEIRAVVALPDGSVWLSTDTEGLIHYRKGRFVCFDEHSGLPTKVMAYRCLARDEAGRLWVGTAEGVVHSFRPAPEPLPTPKPTLLYLEAGSRRLSRQGVAPASLPPNSSIQARFVTLSYPGRNIDYQHRLLGSPDTAWSPPHPANELSYASLSHGAYDLEIRSRQQGGYKWSSPLRIPFQVRKVWFKTWWATVLFVLTAVVLLYYLVYLNVGRLVRRVRRLERALADERRVLHQREAQVQAKEEALEEQEHNLAAKNAVISDQRDEITETASNLQLLHQLIRKLPRHVSWEQVIDAMAAMIGKTKGISAFEFGFYEEGKIHLRGYERRRQNFTYRHEEFSEKSSLAVWSLVHKEPVLINDFRTDQERYVEPSDDYRYSSAIYLPFELAGRQPLLLAVFSLYKNAFEEKDLHMLELLTDYLGMVIKEKMKMQ